MNHYKARQRENDQRWDYTFANVRAGTCPVGYCRAWKPLEPGAVGMLPGQAEQYNAQMAPFVHKFHANGHATAEEACDCYREYLLDHRLQLRDPPPNPPTLSKCVVCGVYTAGVAELGMDRWALCDEHRNRVEVEKLVPKGELESWSSY